MKNQINFARYILDAVNSRIYSLEAEIMIADQQLAPFMASPGTKDDDIRQLCLHRNIRASLHDLYVIYAQLMEENSTGCSPLKRAIQIHLFILKQPRFLIHLNELYGQQSALTTLVGKDYQKFTHDVDLPADLHLRMIALVFPFEFMVDILAEPDVIRTIIYTTLAYKPTKHKDAVSVIFNKIRKFKTLPSLLRSNHFFTPNPPLFFALAEDFVTFFTHGQMFKHFYDPTANLLTHEKSLQILRAGPKSCGIPDDILELLVAHQKTPESQEQWIAGRRELMKTDLEPILEDNSQVFQPIVYAVMEMQKIPLQNSPSSMLFMMSNALGFIKNAFLSSGKSIGAEELYPVLFYAIAATRLTSLPSLVKFISKFTDDALMETQFQQHIAILEMAQEFIEQQELFPSPYFYFPFSSSPTPDLVRDGTECAFLRGFSVYAFPTFSAYSKSTPALLHYTGNDRSVAKAYKYIPSDTFEYGRILEVLDMLDARFIQLTQTFMATELMIRVDNGDYDSDLDSISAISTIRLLDRAFTGRMQTSKLQMYTDIAKQNWKLPSGGPVDSLKILVANIQTDLIMLDYLPQEFTIDGNLNRETFLALKKALKYSDGTVELNQRLLELLHSHAHPI